MADKQIWLLYEEADLAVNRDFAALMALRGREHGLCVTPVTLGELTLSMDGRGEAFVQRGHRRERPDAVISRMREALVSRHLEAAGVPVFNGSAVCEICNDKRRTLQFLHGLPMPQTDFLLSGPPEESSFPLVVKPACSHGGDRVALVRDSHEWSGAFAAIAPQPALQQSVAACPGRDLRVYVLFGQIVAAVMRTAREGVVSNFKRGGQVALHVLNAAEEALARQVIARFQDAGAPLCFAGVDFLYEDGNRPVIGEVEDVVGSRMLYQTSDMDIAGLYLEQLARRL